jgi:hypothetical protein
MGGKDSKKDRAYVLARRIDDSLVFATIESFVESEHKNPDLMW